MNRKASARKRQSAFTFVEVLAAITLLVIGFLGVFSSFHASSLLREATGETNRAVFKLQATVEYIFSRPFDEVTGSLPHGTPASIPGLTDCEPGDNFLLNDEEILVTYDDPAADPLHFTVTITWTSRLGSPRTESLSCARAR